MAAKFARYVGINYSGAETSNAGLTRLRVYAADGDGAPQEIAPPNATVNWTRRSIAEWLVQALGDGVPTAVGIPHAFSFPLDYFVRYRLPPDWRIFLDDFCHFWPTGEAYIYVDFVLDGVSGDVQARHGDRTWLRLTEQRAGRRRSVFQFAGHGSIGKATHAGLPWLRFLDKETHGRTHFWPFDGWEPATGKSMLAEVYPELCAMRWPQVDRNRHQQQAYSIAACLQVADRSSKVSLWTHPPADPEAERIGRLEGWILGVV